MASNHQRGHTSGQFSLVNEFRQSIENHIDTSYDMSFTFDAEPEPAEEIGGKLTEELLDSHDIKVIRSRNGENISILTNGRQPDAAPAGRHYKPRSLPISEHPQTFGEPKKGGFFGMFKPGKSSKATSSTNGDITAIRYDATVQKDAPTEVMFLPARNKTGQRAVAHKQSVASSLAKSTTKSTASPFNVIYGDDYDLASSNMYRTESKSSFASNKSYSHGDVYDTESVQPSFNIYNSNFTGSAQSLAVNTNYEQFKEELVSPTEVQKQNLLTKKSSLDSLKDAIKIEGKKLKKRISTSPTDQDRFSPEFESPGNTIGQEIQINKRGTPKLQTKKSFLRKFSGGTKKGRDLDSLGSSEGNELRSVASVSSAEIE